MVLNTQEKTDSRFKKPDLPSRASADVANAAGQHGRTGRPSVYTMFEQRQMT
jgi:hypothetical protein